MADTTNPTTNTQGADINLNFDDLKIPPAPHEAAEETATSTTPDLNIDFSDVQKPEVKEEVKPVVEETVAPSTSKDDRLAKEDAMVEAKAPEVMVQEVVTPEIETPKVETMQNTPSTSLQEDQKIIDELTATTNTTQPFQPQPQPEMKEEIHEPAPASMDLDALLGTPTPLYSGATTTEVVATTVINQSPQPATETIPATMPGSTFQTTLPPIATPIMQMPTIPAPSPSRGNIAEKQAIPRRKGRKATTLLLLLLLGGAGAYVLKTMYPLEYDSIKANVMSLLGGETTITESTGGLENLLEATGQVAETGELASGGTEEIATGEMIATGNELLNTGGLTTSGFNAFEDLENILTGADANAVLTEQQLTQLKKFSDEAKTFLELGKKINDKVMIKYGIYISKKADGFILSIENKEQIDNDKIAGYLAQFSGYLHQLATLSYDSLNAIPSPAVIPEESSSPASGENNTSTTGTNSQTGMIQDITWESTGSTTSGQTP